MDTRNEEIKYTFEVNATARIGSLGNISGQSSRPCVRIIIEGQKLKPVSGDLSPAHKNTLGVTETMNSTSLSPMHHGRGGTVISKEKIGFSSYKGTDTINSQGFNYTLENFTPKRAFGTMSSKKKTHVLPKLDEVEEFPNRAEPQAKQNRKPYENTAGVGGVAPPTDAFKFLVQK